MKKCIIRTGKDGGMKEIAFCGIWNGDHATCHTNAV